MFSLLVVFLATEPNLFEGVFGKHGDCGGGISPQRGKKKTTTPKFKLLEWGSLCSLSLLSFPPPSSVRARERERKRKRD